MHIYKNMCICNYISIQIFMHNGINPRMVLHRSELSSGHVFTFIILYLDPS